MASTIQTMQSEVGIILSLRIEDLINLEATVDYILERQNEDGGYTFCRGAESNAQDTYYALKILKMLNAEPKNREKTIRFLHSLRHDDGDFDSIKVAYYVVQSLSSLREKPKPMNNIVRSLDVLVEGLKNPHIDVEVVSEVENVYLTVELCKILNLRLDLEKVTKRILRLQNNDGSFGNARRSRIASTYYALGTLKILDYEVETLSETLSWIRLCELPTGRFASSHGLSSIYLEDTYFGVKALGVLNESLRHPEETLRFIAKFQNPNGGFRRSVFLGILDFESTYQAASSVKTILSYLGR